jgi:heterodisulfide reductase subunit A-like polyferredoxin
VAEVTRDPKNKQIYVRYENIELGEVFEQPTDLVILAVGQEPQDGLVKLAEMLDLPIGENGFIDDRIPLDITERTGVAVAGAALGPKGIRYSVKDGLRAAMEVLRFLNLNGQGGE